jgi:pilus assembly protein CpaE
MVENLSILIIDEDPAVRILIRSVFEGMNGLDMLLDTDSLVYGYELIRQNRPKLVFLDLREDGGKSLEMAQRVSAYFKEVFMVITARDMSMETMRACMEAGIRDFLQCPFSAQDVRTVVEKHKLSFMVNHEEGDRTGRIITIFSNKGGLGKTTIAVNLAMALSETVGSPVALVDLNLQLGDITTFLDVEPKQTIVDIARNIGRVDAAYLESSLAQYTCKNATVYVLADPLHVEDAEEVTADQINAVLTVLRSSFQYVVIDTTTSFDTKTLAALDLADQVLLVSMVNLPSIRSSQRLLNLFERLGYDDQKVKLVVNRYMPGEEITVEDVEETLNYPVFWKIPNSYNVVMTAINRGIPIAMVENGKNLEKNFHELAHKVSGMIMKGVTAVNPSSASVQPAVKPSAKTVGLLGNFFSKRP